MNRFNVFILSALVAGCAMLAATISHAAGGVIVQTIEWTTDHDGNSMQILAATIDTLKPMEIYTSTNDGIGVEFRGKRYWGTAAGGSAAYTCTAGDSALFNILMYFSESANGPWIAAACTLVANGVNILADSTTAVASNLAYDIPAWSAVPAGAKYVQPRIAGNHADYTDTLTFTSIKLHIIE